MSDNPLTNQGIVRLLSSTLSTLGEEPEALFVQAGLTASELGRERVDAIRLQQVWRLAVEVTGDDSFGLRVAEQMQPAAFNGLGFAWLASETLNDGLMRLVRYHRLISTHADVELLSEGGSEILWFKIPAGGQPAIASVDAALAIFLKLCRFAKSPDFSPMLVELRRPLPEDRQPFDMCFGTSVQFDQPENRLHFDAHQLLERLPMANAELARINDQVVIEYLKKHDEDALVVRARELLIESLPAGTPNQEQIASEMNMSLRTLQRRLGEHGTSFKQMLDEVRQGLAERYLREGRTIGEVTYLLGFSEPSNFTRSFKRWTDLTPAEYQKQTAD